MNANEHPIVDILAVAAGTALSLLTSEKTLIFVTIVFTIVRTWVTWRDRNLKDDDDER